MVVILVDTIYAANNDVPICRLHFKTNSGFFWIFYKYSNILFFVNILRVRYFGLVCKTNHLPVPHPRPCSPLPSVGTEFFCNPGGWTRGTDFFMFGPLYFHNLIFWNMILFWSFFASQGSPGPRPFGRRWEAPGPWPPRRQGRRARHHAEHSRGQVCTFLKNLRILVRNFFLLSFWNTVYTVYPGKFSHSQNICQNGLNGHFFRLG